MRRPHSLGDVFGQSLGFAADYLPQHNQQKIALEQQMLDNQYRQQQAQRLAGQFGLQRQQFGLQRQQFDLDKRQFGEQQSQNEWNRNFQEAKQALELLYGKNGGAGMFGGVGAQPALTAPEARQRAADLRGSEVSRLTGNANSLLRQHTPGSFKQTISSTGELKDLGDFGASDIGRMRELAQPYQTVDTTDADWWFTGNNYDTTNYRPPAALGPTLDSLQSALGTPVGDVVQGGRGALYRALGGSPMQNAVQGTAARSLQPPPNDGSLSDEEYADFIRLWRQKNGM